MKQLFLIILLGLSTCFFTQAQDFLEEQLEFKRVEKAKVEKENTLASQLRNQGFSYPRFGAIYLRVFKQDMRMEIWIKPQGQQQYILFKDYSVCMLSGIPGPKRMGGDKQIPEGFYNIDKFNPLSGYWLSMRLNYPNLSDVVLGKRGYLGGDIFIHGACQTVGCVPMTDDKIKEIYWLCLQAYQNGQKDIPVHIYPYEYGKGELDTSHNKVEDLAELNRLWNNIAQCYYYFEEKKELPFIHVNQDGSYSFY